MSSAAIFLYSWAGLDFGYACMIASFITRADLILLSSGITPRIGSSSISAMFEIGISVLSPDARVTITPRISLPICSSSLDVFSASVTAGISGLVTIINSSAASIAAIASSPRPAAES